MRVPGPACRVWRATAQAQGSTLAGLGSTLVEPRSTLANLGSTPAGLGSTFVGLGSAFAGLGYIFAGPLEPRVCNSGTRLRGSIVDDPMDLKQKFNFGSHFKTS